MKNTKLLLRLRSRISSKKSGFTIVELLVVIVIIGILAAITIVAYTGINQKAIVATLVSDLNSASTQLKVYQVTNMGYPTSLDCSATPAANSICLKSTNGNTYSAYTQNNTTNPPSFSLTETNTNGTSYVITEGTGPVAVTFSGWSMITAGSYYSCALTSDSKAYCWGMNNYGQLGNNSNTQSLVPVAVNTVGVLSGKTIKSITEGTFHTCAIASDDLAYCWGYNSNGQLGNNSTTNSLVPVAVNTAGVLSGKTIKSIAAGDSHTCAIASDNLIYCWGYNGTGQLGNNSITQSQIPVAVDTTGVLIGKTAKSIKGGISHTCAIASDDLAYCWGANDNTQLGRGSSSDSQVPVAVYTTGVLSGKTIKSIGGNYYHTCSVASNDLSYCWGYNAYGQLGNNSSSQTFMPVTVNTTGVLSGKTMKSTTAGVYHTCAIASDDLGYCWGYDNEGELGNNSTTQSLVPVAVNITGALSGKTMKFIASGMYHTCAIASDNQIYCWGKNSNGQLGNNSTTQSLVPVATVTP